jgi:hypothetical protein
MFKNSGSGIQPRPWFLGTIVEPMNIEALFRCCHKIPQSIILLTAAIEHYFSGELRIPYTEALGCCITTVEH